MTQACDNTHLSQNMQVSAHSIDRVPMGVNIMQELQLWDLDLALHLLQLYLLLPMPMEVSIINKSLKLLTPLSRCPYSTDYVVSKGYGITCTCLLVGLGGWVHGYGKWE